MLEDKRPVEHRSYIDEDTGDIFLRSPSFPAYGSRDWVLCTETQTLTITHHALMPTQYDLAPIVQPCKIIPLLNVWEVNIYLASTPEMFESGGKLRLMGEATYTSGGVGGRAGGFLSRYRFPIIGDDNINVHYSDRDIAQKMYDYIVANAENLR